MTKVTIDRELLERIDESAICDGTDATIADDLFTQLVAALAAPRQPEGEGLEVVAYQSLDATRGGGWMAHKHALPKAHIDQGALQEPLCRLSDAQRAIDELDHKVWEWKAAATAEAHRVDELKVERDTLRQQLADSDAALSESRANDIAAMGHLADMRQQRDKLAGLLAFGRDHVINARHDVEVRANTGNKASALVLAGVDQWLSEIDAALDEAGK